MPQTRPKSIVNIADVELLPRPPQYLPKGVAARRYEARSTVPQDTLDVLDGPILSVSSSASRGS